MLRTRNDIANAIRFWGDKAGPPNGITLPPNTGKLIEILATMDFFKRTTVDLVDGDECAKLVLEAEQSAAASSTLPLPT